MHLRKGTLLKHGDYRIESVLGQGGFGITYLAYQIGLDRKVAVKEFFMSDFCERDPETSHVSLGTSGSRETVEKFKAKFIKEAQTIARLDNPHIIRIHDVFEENDTAYYVMEYIDGQSLKDLLPPGNTLSEAVALGYIRQVSEALAEVHANGLLHLDVKPGNIMVDFKGRAVLIDFGVSKRFNNGGGSENLTTTTTLPYTPGYAPLEQMDPNGSELTPASDIYALGATLYRFLSGESPSAATTRARRKNMESLPESVSPSVRNAVNRAMQIDEENRPQSVEEFLALLDAPAPEISRQEKTEMEHNQNEETELGDIDAVKHEDKGDDGEFVSLFPAEEKTPVSKRIKWIVVALCLLVVIAAALFVNGGESSPAQAEADSLIEQQAESASRTVTAVDLGLPSGTLWADRNVGADSPEDYGDYFAWGETEPKSTYNWDTYKWCNGSYDSMTKYCTDSDYGYNGFTDGKTTLDLSDDAAYVNMGSNWRMPTEKELRELIIGCTWTWSTRNSEKGYKVTGPNGKSIFLPAAGYCNYSELFYAGSNGYYWSSSLYESNPNYSYYLYFNSGNHRLRYDNRYDGHSVRAVAR